MANVKIYTTATCAYCYMEKEYLKSKGIEFEEIVVDTQEKVDELQKSCGNLGVPCTHIVKDDGTDERILGFDKARLDAALGIKA